MNPDKKKVILNFELVKGHPKVKEIQGGSSPRSMD
jgi:hypothetical protein